MFYWNTNSTTRIRPEVCEVLKEYANPKNDEAFHNPSDISTVSKILYQKTIGLTKQALKDLINAQKDDFIIFTSGGSESNNLAFATGEKYIGEGGTIIISPVEHDSINLRCEYLRNLGYKILKLKVDDQGKLDYQHLEKLDVHGRVFLSVMLVNNELGNIYDLKRISKIAHKKWENVLIHTDAVQALGKINIDISDLGIDMLSVSGHKIGAPKGIGALYVRKDVPIQPLIYGHQECGFRGGTENVPYIAAFAKALEITKRQMTTEFSGLLKKHRDKLENGILAICQKLGLKAGVNGDIKHRVANTSSIYILDVDNTELVTKAEEKRLYFSIGAACSSASCATNDDNFTQASPVLKAINHKYYKNVLRFSVGDEFYNYSLEDVSDDYDKKLSNHVKAAINMDIKCGLVDFEFILKKIIKMEDNKCQ